jgi:hypothetical protein
MGEDGISGPGLHAQSQDPSHGFSLASLMMFVTLISVVLGLSTIAPGAGIPLGILLFIAWARTATTLRARASSAAPLTTVQKILAFFSSLGFIVGVLMLVALAIVIGLGSICFGLITVAEALEKKSISLYGGIAILVVGVAAALGLLHLANRLNDDQFSRAVDRSKETPNNRKHP